ncbi:helix-turn-helix domain-containing protein [Ferrimonas marina]|uniref:Transcriptional regulator, contains XRE-family HTH domain n=1 Tax=Ferrimonas marina TaxID=299255 RepID=A0A1M5YVU9_9GAMM|nr:helix-turn-helix domain-containing protein [Ferrimonas marina]SHI15984.1 Transcriptional regulator, contains XRE-family HTH domain [Ferrimonas marina]
MVLKQLRLGRYLSQEQLAQISGLSVRTIQRIESGHKASTESLRCLAAALEVEVETLTQPKVSIDSGSENWKKLPFFVRAWFTFNYLAAKPNRAATQRVIMLSHLFGFLFVVLGWVNETALFGGIVLLSNAYFFELLKWQGDKYGIWFDPEL